MPEFKKRLIELVAPALIGLGYPNLNKDNVQDLPKIISDFIDSVCEEYSTETIPAYKIKEVLRKIIAGASDKNDFEHFIRFNDKIHLKGKDKLPRDISNIESRIEFLCSTITSAKHLLIIMLHDLFSNINFEAVNNSLRNFIKNSCQTPLIIIFPKKSQNHKNGFILKELSSLPQKIIIKAKRNLHGNIYFSVDEFDGILVPTMYFEFDSGLKQNVRLSYIPQSLTSIFLQISIILSYIFRNENEFEVVI